VLRSGAREGDVVALAGDAGVAARGLQLLFERFRDERGEPISPQPATLDFDDHRALARQLRPTPPLAGGPAAAAAGATAMMDVSDGLALDARRLAEASGVTLDLFTAALGEHPARALAGGEDHALLATFPSGAELPERFRIVGRVVARGSVALTVDDRPYDERGGWDPYQDWDRRGG
jgi:thiamine-monophosphate kinase